MTAPDGRHTALTVIDRLNRNRPCTRKSWCKVRPHPPSIEAARVTSYHRRNPIARADDVREIPPRGRSHVGKSSIGLAKLRWVECESSCRFDLGLQHALRSSPILQNRDHADPSHADTEHWDEEIIHVVEPHPGLVAVETFEKVECGRAGEDRLPAHDAGRGLQQEMVKGHTREVFIREESGAGRFSYLQRLQALFVDEPVIDLSEPQEEISAVESRKSLETLSKGHSDATLDCAQIDAVANRAAGHGELPIPEGASVDLIHRAVPKVERPQQPLREDVFARPVGRTNRDVLAAEETVINAELLSSFD